MPTTPGGEAGCTSTRRKCKVPGIEGGMKNWGQGSTIALELLHGKEGPVSTDFYSHVKLWNVYPKLPLAGVNTCIIPLQ